METYRTEEEQIEALRRWWREYGWRTLGVVLLVVAAGLGWQGWQGMRDEQTQGASAVYDDMMKETRRAGSDEARVNAREHAQTLKDEYGHTIYASFARLHLARMAVEDGDLESAEVELREVLDSSPGDEMEVLVQLRLARVLAARGDAEAALEILTTVEADTYAASYAEARGDIHTQLGNVDEAIAAFEEAITLIEEDGQEPGEALALKLAALTPVPARALDAEMDSADTDSTEMDSTEMGDTDTDTAAAPEATDTEDSNSTEDPTDE